MTTKQWQRCLRVGAALTLIGCVLVSTQAPARAARPGLIPAAAAQDGPGALSHFDLARKDCLGTASNTGSKVWFTVAKGVLSDVYYPTNDNTNVETLQYVVTDGSTFTDLQTRDTSYTVQLLGPFGCRVITTANSGLYRITTDYVIDPDRNTVVMRAFFQQLSGNIPLQLYVRYDPSINGNGGGGSGNGGGDTGTVDTLTGHNVLIASDTVTATNAANRTYAVPVYSALDASTPFVQVTNGFVGAASDGLTQLETAHALTSSFDTATDGNLVQTAQVALQAGKDAPTARTPGQTFTLALGFGTSQTAAVSAAEGSLARPFDAIRGSYDQGWLTYAALLNHPQLPLDGLSPQQRETLDDEYYLNANLLKAAEDKTFPGALQAGPTSPWGQAISAGDPNNTYFGSYREVFARDLYEEWTGLVADGDLATARDAVLFLFDRQQQPDGSMPRNSLTNGQSAPDSFGTQLDEASYPIIMAYQLQMTDADLYQHHIKPAANFVMSHGPAFGVERWEEQSGYSPSTIAAEVAGLIAAADIAERNGDAQSAALWRGTADQWQRSIKGWTVTTTGPLANHPYFIRLSKTGDPNAAITYNLGNGGPTLDQRSVIDQGFLELVRLGLLPANDPDVVQSLPVVDATIMTTTPSGPGWHRYNGDGYGDAATTGQPWAPSGQGTGHIWPVLTGERAEYALASGDTATAIQLLATMQRFASGVGLIPEQDWDLPDLAPSPFGTDPTVASIGFQDGHAAGSSAPLNWAEGQYIRLLRDIGAGTILERPEDTYARYVLHQQEQTSLTITSPANLTAVSAANVTVTGTSVAGNSIVVAATDTDTQSSTVTASGTADSNGTFSVPITVGPGTNVITVVATSPSGATASAQVTVVFDFTPGTSLLDVTDPTGDDNGPGNYAYPTDPAFHAGAFDIQEFSIHDDGINYIFKLKVRDLTPTFGSPLGAQLVDVYVHDPNASPGDTSTAASFPQRNYTIATGSAWSRLLEVQGFGQRFIDAHNTTLGTINNIGGNSITRQISFSVVKSQLGGQIGSGWGFTVVLTGQDGFSPDQARGFAATPQPFQFGVCATASNDPHCTVDPSTVPKVMDVITPPGVNQSTELDYTLGPVVLQDVTIP